MGSHISCDRVPAGRGGSGWGMTPGIVGPLGGRPGGCGGGGPIYAVCCRGGLRPVGGLLRCVAPGRVLI
jgi:hypothetical protein